MSATDAGSEPVDRASSEPELPEISQLLSSATPEDMTKKSAGAADDGLSYDGERPEEDDEEVEDEKVEDGEDDEDDEDDDEDDENGEDDDEDDDEDNEDEVQSQMGSQASDEIREDEEHSGFVSQADDEAQSLTGSHDQSIASSSTRAGDDKRPGTAVKTEKISPPVIAEQHTSSRRSKSKPTLAPTNEPAKPSSNKANTGAKSKVLAQNTDSGVGSSSANQKTTKRKQHDESDAAASNARPKTRRRVEDTFPTLEALDPDIQEIFPSTPKPRPKIKKLASSATLSASQPARLPSAVQNVMALPSPPATQVSSKRTRRDTAEASSPSIPLMSQSQKTKQSRALSKAKRSERFWYLDGSIVLLVEKTLYKLHRSRLSTVSLYFARLFGDPLPASRHAPDDEKDDDYEDPEIVEVTKGDSEGPIDGEVIDSCPVYRVTCISAGDFDCLLSTLNEGITFAFKKPSFLELASLLRASYTLECPPYLEYATRVLREMWPDQLCQLDPEPSEEQRNFAKETLQLSRECGIPEVRKRAYYELLRTPGFGQVFVSDSDSDEFIDDEDLLQDSQSTLRYVDIVRLVRTREQLQRAWIEIARAPPAPSVVPCALEKIPDEKLNPAQGPARNGCRAARDKSAGWWTEQVVCAPLFEQGLLDPLTALEVLVDVKWDELGFCGHCVGERRQLWEDEGEKLWGRLDRWLGLAAPEEDKKKKGRVK